MDLITNPFAKTVLFKIFAYAEDNGQASRYLTNASFDMTQLGGHLLTNA